MEELCCCPLILWMKVGQNFKNFVQFVRSVVSSQAQNGLSGGLKFKKDFIWENLKKKPKMPNSEGARPPLLTPRYGPAVC